jgi:hypothetical protein
LNPSLVTFGGQLFSLPIALVVFTLVVGVSEEGAKFLGAWSLAGHRRELDEPVDGIVYGAASALGFAAVENIKYFAVGRLAPALIVARMFMSIPAHLFFGSIWGYALGQRLVKKRTHVWLFVAAAAVLHGSFDTFLSIDQTRYFALALNLLLASTFIWLLRRALRRGAVTLGAGEPPPSAARLLFSMGAPLQFAFAAILVHVFAGLVFVAGIGLQAMHGRVNMGFLVLSTAFVAGLAFSAYWLTSTMPIDAAIDHEGVTFSGAMRAWNTIRGVERVSPSFLRIRSAAGDLFVGPGGPAELEGVARAIRARVD